MYKDLYIKPPTELNIAHNMVLKVIKPLYGIPEVGNYWFNTYHTQEKRLMVDLMCLRQLYERREIAEIKWIEGNTNPADSMIKSKACNALKQLIDTNKVNISVMEWVERK